MEDCFSWGSVRKKQLGEGGGAGERGAQDVVEVPTKWVAASRGVLQNRRDGALMAWEVLCASE